jgi:hypothetical protein
VQRQTANGTWKSVKSARVKAGGKISVKVSASKAARYRLVVTGGQQTWSSTSKIVKK